MTNQYKRIGIIGLGYVGSAMSTTLQSIMKNNVIHTYDINNSGNNNSIDSLAENSDIIFVCVPTPMDSNGACNTSIVESILSSINNFSSNYSDKIIVIKSTVPIGSTDYFNNKFENLHILFNPEFLREESFLEDCANQDRILIGGDPNDAIILKEFYESVFVGIPVFTMDSPIAETVKYVTNSFLAVKVSYANEIASLCRAKNIDYNQVIEIATLDSRLGNSHWAVPGPDGKKGFGGSCFPKDIMSLIHQFSENDIESLILKSSWERNCTVDRPEKDWEILKGRAVSEN